MIALAVFMGLRSATPTTSPPSTVEDAPATPDSPRSRAVFEERERSVRARELGEDRRRPDAPAPAPEQADAAKAVPPAPSPREPSQVAKLASAQAEAMRPQIRSECSDVRPEGGASSSQILVNLAFGSDGRVVASGTSQIREDGERGDAGDADGADLTAMANCVGRVLHSMQIAPPGDRVAVEIPFELE
jgi:hypothetical protein